MIFLTLKSLHLISMVAWMVGMFYLPRIYVYHTGVDPKSEASQIFKIMERKLLRLIVNPAMIITLISGIGAAFYKYDNAWPVWLHWKLSCIGLLILFHVLLSRWRRDFEADNNQHSARFYRLVNEIPTVLLIAIISLAVFR